MIIPSLSLSHKHTHPFTPIHSLSVIFSHRDIDGWESEIVPHLCLYFIRLLPSIFNVISPRSYLLITISFSLVAVMGSPNSSQLIACGPTSYRRLTITGFRERFKPSSPKKSGWIGKQSVANLTYYSAKLRHTDWSIAFIIHRGSITVQFVSILTRLESTKHENMLLFECNNAAET